MSIMTLHNALAAVCPISGVSLGNLTDKATWRIDFQSSATPAQQTAAQSVLASFDINAPSADDTRVATLNSDAQVVDWINKLANSSATDVDTFFTNNVTTAAQAITVLKAVVKVLAYKLR